MAIVDLDLVRRQMVEQKTRQRTEVHVGAGFDFRRSNRLVRIAPFHDEGNPLAQFVRIIRQDHPFEQRILCERFQSFFQKVHVFRALYHTHMRNRTDERLRLPN